jgi:hypothetical protein
MPLVATGRFLRELEQVLCLNLPGKEGYPDSVSAGSP